LVDSLEEVKLKSDQKETSEKIIKEEKTLKDDKKEKK